MTELVTHSFAAPDYLRSADGQALDSGPCLVWSNDDGNYLASSGHPTLMDPEIPDRFKTVQARGGLGQAGSPECPTSTGYFAEYLPLTDTRWWGEGGTTFAAQITHHFQQGATWLVLTVTDQNEDTGEPGSMRIGFC